MPSFTCMSSLWLTGFSYDYIIIIIVMIIMICQTNGYEFNLSIELSSWGLRNLQKSPLVDFFLSCSNINPGFPHGFPMWLMCLKFSILSTGFKNLWSRLGHRICDLEVFFFSLSILPETTHTPLKGWNYFSLQNHFFEIPPFSFGLLWLAHTYLLRRRNEARTQK